MFPNFQEANCLITWILKMHGVGSTYSIGGTQGNIVRVSLLPLTLGSWTYVVQLSGTLNQALGDFVCFIFVFKI